jgi:hypothetical protein
MLITFSGCYKWSPCVHDLVVESNVLPGKLDICLLWTEYWSPESNFRIFAPSICPDGSRARLAWVTDIVKDRRILKCKIQQVLLEEELTDINDGALNRCITD